MAIWAIDTALLIVAAKFRFILRYHVTLVRSPTAKLPTNLLFLFHGQWLDARRWRLGLVALRDGRSWGRGARRGCGAASERRAAQDQANCQDVMSQAHLDFTGPVD
jgi:hypothetical protein